MRIKSFRRWRETKTQCASYSVLSTSVIRSTRTRSRAGSIARSNPCSVPNGLCVSVASLRWFWLLLVAHQGLGTVEIINNTWNAASVSRDMVWFVRCKSPSDFKLKFSIHLILPISRFRHGVLRHFTKNGWKFHRIFNVYSMGFHRETPLNILTRVSYARNLGQHCWLSNSALWDVSVMPCAFRAAESWW